MTTTTRTKRADYIVTELSDGQVAIVTSPHDGSDASRAVFREMAAARHWLKMQCERDAGLKHATQGLLKATLGYKA